MTNLKLLYQLGAALGSSFDVSQVLEVVMDLVFEHVKADRGIILLVDPKKEGELLPQVVRTRDERPPIDKHDTRIAIPSDDDDKLEAEKIHASRTVINHVVNTGEGVLSSNAMTDQRFSKSKSVHVSRALKRSPALHSPSMGNVQALPNGQGLVGRVPAIGT